MASRLKPAGSHGDRLIRSLLARRGGADLREAAVFVRLLLFVGITLFGHLTYGIGFIFMERYLSGAFLLTGAALSLMVFVVAKQTRGQVALHRVSHLAVVSLVVTVAGVSWLGGEAGELSAWFLALAAGGAVFLLSERGAWLWLILISVLLFCMDWLRVPMDVPAAYQVEPWEDVMSQAGMAFIVTWFAAAVRRTTDAHIDTLTAHDRERAAQTLKLRAALFEQQRSQEELTRARDAAESAMEAAESARLSAEREREIAENARRAAEEASLAKSRFLANMSHELRTPLNAILGFSELITEEAEDTGMTEALADVAHIHTAGTHLLKLINDLLDIAKIEAGRSDLRLEHFDVRERAFEIVETLRPLAEANGDVVHVEIGPGVRPVWSDPTRVGQVMINLLSNAVKFTKNGRVDLVLNSVDGDELEIRVTDTGIGIAPDQLESIFEPFRQAEMSFNRSYEGTGLGLTIARQCVELLGGSIGVESQVGRGTSFSVRLPVDATPPTMAITGVGDAEPEPAGPRETTTVLVIDDDAAVRQIVARHLGRVGCYVITAATGETGLELAQHQRPDVVLLDILLPDIDGWAVLSALKSEAGTEDIPVVVITNVDSADLAYSLGASDFLTKPVTRGQLVAAISYLGLALEQDARP